MPSRCFVLCFPEKCTHSKKQCHRVLRSSIQGAAPRRLCQPQAESQDNLVLLRCTLLTRILHYDCHVQERIAMFASVISSGNFRLDVMVQVLDEVTDVTLTKYLPKKPLMNGVKMNGLVH